MTIKITSLFATVTIAGILSMAPFMAMPNQAFAGGCSGASSATLGILLSGARICVDDKTFENFRNYKGDITFFDQSQGPFDPNDIFVTGVTVNGEHGLEFTSQLLVVFNGINPPASPQAIGIGFDYDVIASDNLISDNTLTMESIVSVTNPSTQTRVEVTEQVHGALLQTDPFIALKQVFEDGTLAFVKSDHVDFAVPDDSISVNTDIGLTLDPQTLGSAAITKFTQTFSQEPEEPPKEPPVGGEFLPIDTTALLVAGAQTNALWILSTLAVIGSIAFGALYLTTRRA